MRGEGVWNWYSIVQLISDVFEQIMLRILEIYALEHVVFYIAVYGLYKPYISYIHNTECSNADALG